MSGVSELTVERHAPSVAALPPLRIRVDKTARAGEQLVDRKCNLACLWCHGDFFGHRIGLPAIGNESLVQAVRLTIAAAGRSQADIKISGQGEPCLTGVDELCDLIARLRSLPRVRQVKLITNGTILADMATDLAAAGLSAVTVTLNSLNPETYALITGRESLSRALSGIQAALRAGLRTKLNVIYSALNAGEAWDFVRFSGENGGMVVRFLDLLIVAPELHRLYRPLSDLDGLLRPLATSKRIIVKPYRAIEYDFAHMGAAVQIKTAGRINECPNRGCAHRSVCLEGCRSSVRIAQDGTLHPCGVRTDNVIDLTDSGTTVERVREALSSGGKGDWPEATNGTAGSAEGVRSLAHG